MYGESVMKLFRKWVNNRGRVSVRFPLQICVCVIMGALILFFVACPEEGPVASAYTCDNGTPADGVPDGSSGAERCVACDDGHSLTDSICEPNMHVCANGTPVDELPSEPGVQACMACNRGFTLNATTMMCEGNIFDCPGGMAMAVDDGRPDTDGEIRCASCNDGFVLDEPMCRPPMYTCPNGTALDEPLTGDTDVPGCEVCNEGFVLDEDDPVCRLPMYTCPNGMAMEGTPGGDTDVALCVSCIGGFVLENQACRAARFTWKMALRETTAIPTRTKTCFPAHTLVDNMTMCRPHFYRHSNGVTIMCDDAANAVIRGDVDDVTYTKRDTSADNARQCGNHLHQRHYPMNDQFDNNNIGGPDDRHL